MAVSLAYLVAADQLQLSAAHDARMTLQRRGGQRPASLYSRAAGQVARPAPPAEIAARSYEPIHGGAYFGLDGVDPWDEQRDARKYLGPHPAVAHPPCPRWGKLWAGQPLYIKRTGIRQKKGDDGGCFEAALASVRKYGGVIEHPWGSHAWPHFGLTVPPRAGGWVKADEFGGWTCCVEQGRYGHYARKPTLLVVYGMAREDLPELHWGKTSWEPAPELVARIGLKRAKRLGELCAKGGGRDSAPRINTPEPFRDLLIDIARACGGAAEGCVEHGLAHPCEACAVQAAYEEAQADHSRLVRELDVLLNGESAAQQASLCDIVAQVRREGIRSPLRSPL